MSQDGNPPDPPGEEPWSPYPQNWDSFTSAPQPARHYGPPPDDPGQPSTAPPPLHPYGVSPTAVAPDFAFGGFASWLSRVGAYLIDSILGSLVGFPTWIGYFSLLSSATTTTDSNGVANVEFHAATGSVALILLGSLMSLAFLVWNTFLRQGRTGASIGKGVLGLRLVNTDLQPIGAGWAFLRYLLHILDSLPCGLGYLWPIWDDRRQTFADKIAGTIVINANKVQPRAF